MENTKRVSLITDEIYIDYKKQTSHDLAQIIQNDYSAIRQALDTFLQLEQNMVINNGPKPEKKYRDQAHKTIQYRINEIIRVTAEYLLKHRNDYPPIGDDPNLRAKFGLRGKDVENHYYPHMAYFRTLEMVSNLIDTIGIPDIFQRSIIDGFITSSVGPLKPVEDIICQTVLSMFLAMGDERIYISAANIKRASKIIRSCPDIASELIPTPWSRNAAFNDNIISVEYWKDRLNNNGIAVQKIKRLLIDNFIQIYYSNILALFNVRRENNTSKLDYWSEDIHKYQDVFNINMDMGVYAVISQLCNSPENIVLTEEEV